MEEGRLEGRRVRAPRQLAHGAVDEELPVVQERDIVADFLDLAEKVGAYEHRAAFSLERLDPIADLGHAARIQSRGGLVEDQEFGLIEKRLRDREALLHSLRKLLDSVVRPVRQLDFLEDRLAAAFNLVLRHAAKASHVRERLERRQVTVELRRLNHGADAGESPGRLLTDIDAEQGGAASGGSDQVRHQLDRRGLPGAVRAEEPQGRALRDREFEGLQGGEVTVVLTQPLQVDRGLAGDRLRAGGLHGHRDISRYT